MANEATRAWVEQRFRASIVPTLLDYIRIPNKSPVFDPAWKAHGGMDRAVALLAGWARDHLPEGARLEVVQLGERTPVILIDALWTGGVKGDTVLLYGHLDKQPEMTGWREGLSPWVPVREGNKLFGRGGADDGYSAFASLTALRLLQEQQVPHARCVVLIEAGEESGSPDLPAYIEHLAARIGTPSLVICLDSGCGNYDQLWMPTSLRGLVAGNLRVDILTEGVHSGDASGIVPSSFRILRQLLSRLEDEQTGKIRLDALQIQISNERLKQARLTAEALGDEVWNKFPFAQGARPVVTDKVEMILNRTWRPALSITGIDGLPPLGSAGNVLRPFTACKISLRIPPRIDPAAATKAVKDALEKDPPHGARVVFDGEKSSTGWDAPPLAQWLSSAVERASRNYFGKAPMAFGEGGTIPFMGMLGEKFPEAQFLITGVLGPGSNAHGPNEFLHVPTGIRLTGCVASVIAEHFAR